MLARQTCESLGTSIQVFWSTKSKLPLYQRNYARVQSNSYRVALKCCSRNNVAGSARRREGRDVVCRALQSDAETKQRYVQTAVYLRAFFGQAHKQLPCATERKLMAR